MEYKIHHSKLIEENYSSFVENCQEIYKKLNSLYGDDTTWNFDKYNVFSITSSSVLFYSLFYELRYHIRSIVGDNRPLWIQSWLNYHINPQKTLNALGKDKRGFHGHDALYHGYISIDPQDTVTKFRNGFELKNKIGQIYLGPGLDNKKGKDGEWDHYVEYLSLSPLPRITIAFDVCEHQNLDLNISYIPLL